MEYTFNRSLCRLCLCYDVSYVDIFKHDASQEHNLTSVILELLELKVSEEDVYPNAVCSACFKIIIDFKKFKDECQQAKITYDKNIRPQEFPNVNRQSQELDNVIEETSVRPKLEFHIDNYDMWGNLITEDSKSEVNIPTVVKTENDLDEVYHQNASLTAAPHDDVDEYHNSIDRKKSGQNSHKCSMCGMEFHFLSLLDLHLKSHEMNPSQQESSEIIVDHVKEEECMSPGVLSADFEMNHESNPVEQSTENIKPECSKEFSKKCYYTRHSRVHKSLTSSSSEHNPESISTLSTDLNLKEVNRVTTSINVLQDERKRTLDLESKSRESNGKTSVELHRTLTSSKLDKSNKDEIECIQQGDSLIASEFQSGRMTTMEECHSFEEEQELEVEDVGWKLRNSAVKKGEDNVDGMFSHYTCDHCSKAFNDSHIFKMHLSLHERHASIEGKEVTSTNEEVNKNANNNIGRISYNCGVCRRKFKRKDVLKTHMRIHSNRKPYNCGVCHQVFRWKHCRDRHVVRIHQNYRCSYCHKLFRVKDELVGHVQECRVKKVFSCNWCNKCFDNRSSCDKHLTTHTTEKAFKCRYCDKCFGRKDALCRHERIHTREILFVCSFCGKSFTDRSNYNAHVRLHTSDKRYKCSYCDKSFKRNTQLRIHKKKKHPEEKTVQVQCL